LPGFKGINFQSLLALEAETGLCNKTGRASAPSDWIDTVVSRINAFNSDPQHAVSPITLGEAWVMLKDRLIQDPTFNTVAPSGFSWSEYDALNAFLNAVLPISSGTTTATSATASFLGTKTLGDMLREGCGILVKSPQFVLTNITPKTYSVYVPAPLRLNVCLGTEPCGYAQLCGHYRETLGTMGRSLGCLGRGVYDNPSFPFDPNANAAGRLVAAPSSGQTWAMLTRQTSDPPAVRLPAPSPAAATREPEFDLIARVRPRERLKGLNRVAQRFATLCPGGLCGFLARPAPNIARCLENPANNVCRVLFPPCDPRSEGGAGSCGSAPADFGASGVLAAWAEGAEVKSAANARLLRSGEQVWQLVRAGIKLQAGDLIDLPFTASLRLTAGNVTFGDQAMEEARVSGLRGHLLAVTGPSAEKLLAVPMRRGALSPADLIKGEQAGAYRSRVMTQADLRRAAPLSTVHVQAPAPSRKEMMERNAQFDELHRGFPWGGRPRERPR
jgi:hypothetical protein